MRLLRRVELAQAAAGRGPGSKSKRSFAPSNKRTTGGGGDGERGGCHMGKPEEMNDWLSAGHSANSSSDVRRTTPGAARSTAGV